MTTLEWHVAHTRPRCEKKLQRYCERNALEATLPCYRSIKKYRGKRVVFYKPLFPGYLFLNLLPSHRSTVLQSDYIANLLAVPDQATFSKQLSEILLSLETDLEVRLAPQIHPGTHARIKSGPLRGIEGWVERRSGAVYVLLRLDFINQAAAVKIEATDLELV
jgi:transcription antitermination factor NusG